MGAILGFVHLDGRPAERERLARMAQRLRHRGTGAAAMSCEGAVGLAQLSRRSPASVESGVCVADARIDNRSALIDLLGVGTPDPTDARLILAAHERWGDDCPDRLIGDFAFAIWDAKRRRLFCGRDPFGVRPLYYYRAPETLFFASEIKAILCNEEVPRELNELRLAEYLTGSLQDRESTLYGGVQRLAAGSRMSVDVSGLGVARYFHLDHRRRLELATNAEYEEAFRAQLTEAVRCRMRDVESAGAMLSGGLDSSSIACLARDLHREGGAGPLPVFSAVFPRYEGTERKRIDEREFQDAVVAGGGFEHHAVRADRISPFYRHDRVLEIEDEALLAPNLYMHWALFEAASERGIQVMLDGIDGDVVVCHGKSALTDYFRGGRWLLMLREARALARRSPNRRATPLRLAWDCGIRPLVPGWVHRRRRGRRAPRIQVWPTGLILSEEFEERTRIRERIAAAETFTPARSCGEDHQRGLEAPLYQYALEGLDKVGAHQGLEARFPFFDRRLVELCLSLPPDQKLSDGWTRSILRRSMGGSLPDRVRWRLGKGNLSVHLRRAMLERDGDLIRHEILEDPSPLAPFLNLDALRFAYRGLERGRGSAALPVYAATNLGLWLRNWRTTIR